MPGGKKTTNLHPDTSNVSVQQLPKTVGGEFGRGDFTLGIPFVPSLATRQADALEKLNLDPAAAFDPMIVWLAAVPEECSTDSLGLRIEPTADEALSCIPPTCGMIEATGFTFEVVRQRFDSAIVKDTNDMDAAAIGTPTVIGASPLNCDNYDFTRVALTQHVATGETMLIGIRILTPPDAGADRMAGLQCRITPVVKVHDYANPLQIM